MIDKLKTFERKKAVKSIQYYEDDYLFCCHLTVYVDNYKNIIKDEFINSELSRNYSDITNSTLTKVICNIEM